MVNKKAIIFELSKINDLVTEQAAAIAVGWSHANVRYHVAQGNLIRYPDVEDNFKMKVSLSQVETIASRKRRGRVLTVTKRQLAYERKRSGLQVWVTPKEKNKWEAYCSNHKTSSFHHTKKIAVAALAQAADWCDGCRAKKESHNE